MSLANIETQEKTNSTRISVTKFAILRKLLLKRMSLEWFITSPP